MKPVIIFRHIECEGPGYLAEVLDRRGIPWKMIAIDRDESVPASLPDCSGLVFMGGPMSVNDDLPWIEAELDLIRAADAVGLPVLGHCLGGQLIARALGGKVVANPVREIGWHPVAAVAAGVRAAGMEALPASFLAFHWHGETFELPPGATHLLENRFCTNQGFIKGSVLALQCHVEMTTELVQQWTGLYADELAVPTDSVQAADVILESLDKKCAELQRGADLLYGYWLAHLQT